ncbi:MAG: hypothetical protein AAF791_01520 [Bacteroidota bacterium]
MTQRFEPEIRGLLRRRALPSPIAGMVVGLGIYYGDRGASLSTAVWWGIGTTLAAFAFAFLRDYWLRLWTVEVSDAGIRAVSPKAEYVVRWNEMTALDESYHGDSWTIEWGEEQTKAPHYLAPESLTIALNAYSPPEADRLTQMLRARVKQYGISSKYSVASPAR